MARLELPLIGPHYTSREKPLSAQVTRNMWPEINSEARNQVSLHNTAGTRTFATLEGIDRGIHDFNNLLYAVNGQSLYSIDADGINRNLGTIEGTERCVMANDSTQLIITTGDIPYRYTVDGGVEEITDPDLVKPVSVAYLNSQFIFDQNAGVFGEFVTSSIEPGLAIDALDFAQAEGHPDDIIRVLAFRQLVYFFGSHTIEPWQNTGQGNPPFARMRGGVKPYGLAGTHGVVATSEFMYFLDEKRIPRRSNGLDYINIGNPALGVEFAKYSKISDVIAFAFTQDHQQFFALTFPTANRTWVFHEASGTWFQLSHGIGLDRHRASSMIHMYGLNYCADHSNGLLYEYSLDIYTDNGLPIIRERDTAAIHGGLFGAPGKKLFFDEVEFIIVAGSTPVEGTGPGPQPEPIVSGICGTVADLQRGQLLNVGPIQMANVHTHAVVETDVHAAGITFDDTKVFSFTAAFMRELVPGAGTKAHIFQFAGAAAVLELYCDENGFLQMIGKNAADATILDLTIKNAGLSFADSALHFIGGVIDLEDTEKREIYLDGLKVTESAIYTTWTTYVDDTIPLAAAAGGGNNRSYTFGTDNLIPGEGWGADGGGVDAGIDSLGYCTFDDTCNLITASLFDAEGWLTDPQAWSGWYKTQPQVFFGPSFWRNSGKTGSTSYGDGGFEKLYQQTLPSAADYYVVPAKLNLQVEQSLVNLGIGGNTQANYGTSLPTPPGGEGVIEIVSPFWDNMDNGNWIDISKLTNTTFQGMFGTIIEGDDFNSVFAVNKAALTNTGNDGNRLQIQDSNDATDGALILTDSLGNVIDHQIYAGAPNGDSILVPTGNDYYVVATSDTGNAKIRKWDTTVINTVGSTPWSTVFGVEFGTTTVSRSDRVIPAEGISIAFTVPDTSDSVHVSFTTLENVNVTGGRFGSVNQGVLDFNTPPTYSWGLGGGINGGINFPGQDIALIPGETYFFNVRNNDPKATGNWVSLRVFYVVN